MLRGSRDGAVGAIREASLEAKLQLGGVSHRSITLASDKHLC